MSSFRNTQENKLLLPTKKMMSFYAEIHLSSPLVLQDRQKKNHMKSNR